MNHNKLPLYAVSYLTTVLLGAPAQANAADAKPLPRIYAEVAVAGQRPVVPATASRELQRVFAGEVDRCVVQDANVAAAAIHLRLSCAEGVWTADWTPQPWAKAAMWPAEWRWSGPQAAADGPTRFPTLWQRWLGWRRQVQWGFGSASGATEGGLGVLASALRETGRDRPLAQFAGLPDKYATVDECVDYAVLGLLLQAENVGSKADACLQAVSADPALVRPVALALAADPTAAADAALRMELGQRSIGVWPTFRLLVAQRALSVAERLARSAATVGAGDSPWADLALLTAMAIGDPVLVQQNLSAKPAPSQPLRWEAAVWMADGPDPGAALVELSGHDDPSLVAVVLRAQSAATAASDASGESATVKWTALQARLAKAPLGQVARLGFALGVGDAEQARAAWDQLGPLRTVPELVRLEPKLLVLEGKLDVARSRYQQLVLAAPSDLRLRWEYVWLLMQIDPQAGRAEAAALRRESMGPAAASPPSWFDDQTRKALEEVDGASGPQAATDEAAASLEPSYATQTRSSLPAMPIFALLAGLTAAGLYAWQRARGGRK